MNKLRRKLRRWLGVPKDLTADLTKLEREMWKHRHLLQKRAITKCPGCTKNLKLWPLETESYYTKDGQAYHVPCYTKIQALAYEKSGVRTTGTQLKGDDMDEKLRQKAHKALDVWLDGKDAAPEYVGRENSPQMVYLGYKFAKVLSEAKPNA